MADFTDDDIKAARALCADLADKGPGQSTAYRLELNSDAARLLPAALDALESTRRDLAATRAALAERNARIAALFTPRCTCALYTTFTPAPCELHGDIARLKAALAEAIALIESVTTSIPHLHVHYEPTIAALKAKVQP